MNNKASLSVLCNFFRKAPVWFGYISPYIHMKWNIWASPRVSFAQRKNLFIMVFAPSIYFQFKTIWVIINLKRNEQVNFCFLNCIFYEAVSRSDTRRRKRVMCMLLCLILAEIESNSKLNICADLCRVEFFMQFYFVYMNLWRLRPSIQFGVDISYFVVCTEITIS